MTTTIPKEEGQPILEKKPTTPEAPPKTPEAEKQKEVAGEAGELSGLREGNVELGGEVETAEAEAVADALIADPDPDVDKQIMGQVELPAVGKEGVVAVKDEAEGLRGKIKGLSVEEAKKMAQEFCQKHYGASLSEVGRSLASTWIDMDSIDFTKKLVKGEATKEDVGRQLLETIPFWGMFAKAYREITDTTTQEKLRKCMIRARLAKDAFKAIGCALPEARAFTVPADYMLRKYGDEAERQSKLSGELSVWDSFKGFGRSMWPEKAEDQEALVSNMGEILGTEGYAKEIGLSEDSVEMLNTVSGVMKKHPELISKTMGRFFAE